MTLEALGAALPDYARDLRLNLRTVLSPAGAPGLSEAQIWMTAVAAAIASRNGALARQVEALAQAHLPPQALSAAKAAAAVMGMNNIYYRFTHLIDDGEYRTLPARLRMNALAAPGIAKADVELLALAVSAVNGCGRCLNAHDLALKRHGIGREAIQSAVRIAAVLHAAATTLAFERAA